MLLESAKSAGEAASSPCNSYPRTSRPSGVWILQEPAPATPREECLVGVLLRHLLLRALERMRALAVQRGETDVEEARGAVRLILLARRLPARPIICDAHVRRSFESDNHGGDPRDALEPVRQVDLESDGVSSLRDKEGEKEGAMSSCSVQPRVCQTL